MDVIGYLFSIVVGILILVQQYRSTHSTLARIQAGEYKEYSTPDWIDKYWYLTGKARVCDGCGVEDYPVIGDWTGHYCKWCRELQMLNRHLNTHGARRLKRR